MPTVNVTVDDTEPMFEYQPQASWKYDRKNSAYGSSYRFTYEIGATVAFNFTGTSVSIFGTKRANHDLFNVTLDGKTSTLSEYNQKPLNKQLIFSASDLENTLHTVMLANAGTKPTSNNSNVLSFDYVTFEHSTPDSGSSSNITIQATDTSFVYEPKSAWSSLTTNGVLESSTNQSGASVSLDFYGRFIQVFGNTIGSSGTYTVSLDGNSPTTYNTTNTSIFYKDQLKSGHHTLNIVNQPVTPGSQLAINYAVVDSVAPHSSKSLSRGAIAGIVIGNLAAIGILIGTVIFIWKRIHSKPHLDDARMPRPFHSPLFRQPHENRQMSKTEPSNQPTNRGDPRHAHSEIDRPSTQSPARQVELPPQYTQVSNYYGLRPNR